MKNSCFKEFFKYASLNVFGMIGLSCYILADTFFISKGMGSDGLTALNIAIPIYSLMRGAGLMVGMGGAIRYSIYQSQGKQEKADNAFSVTLFLCAFFALIYFFMGLLFAEPIARLLGAEGNVLTMTTTYLRVLLLFSPAFIYNDTMICFIRNDGAPSLSMTAMLMGSLSNIILDYVFIFTCGWGIFGAILATGLAPCISLLIQSSYIFRKKNKFHFHKPVFEKSLVGKIFSGGLPSLVTELSNGIVVLIFNFILLDISGNIGVAAYGVIANLSIVVMAVYTGIAQGVQPVVSKYFGMGNQKNVSSVLKYSLIAIGIISALMYAVIFFGADKITSIFNSENNSQLQKMAVYGLKIYFTASIFAGFNIVMSAFFTSVDNAKPGGIVSLLRGFFVIIPMSFLLSSLWGITGLWAVFPATEIIVAAVSLIFIIKSRNDKTSI